MKTSARNQFLGKVTTVKRGAANDEIELKIVGGERIIAIITHESTEALGLALGAEVFALIKSTSVIVVIDDKEVNFSARNRLRGTISRVESGAVNTEVIIELAGGGSIASIITNESSISLGLVVGAKAMGIFKASSVILGITA